jgi:hypothetical protein
MEDKYKKLFGYINLIEPPKSLGERILARINTEEKRAMRLKAWAFGSASFASLGFSLWAVVYLVGNLNETGFCQYLSLLFSGDSTVYYYWKEISLSIAESLPIVSIILFLTAIGFFIWSITKLTYKTYEFRY